ncbi:MAG: hypothetical protein J4F31_11590 [Flavobacteriales bacterium]|nr:hypothetical protein [Flavobacteriales bacterium]
MTDFPIAAIAKVWDPSTGSYADVDEGDATAANRIIPPFQGFWIKFTTPPTVNPTTLAIDLDHRDLTTTSFRGSTPTEALELTATQPAFGAEHTARLKLINGGDNNYEGMDGMHKDGEAWESIHLYYYSEDGQQLSTNSANGDWTGTKTYPLYFEIWLDTVVPYQIDMTNNPFPASWTVELYDRKSGNTHDLTNGTYYFNAINSDDLHRFGLIINKSTIGLSELDQDFYWYEQNDQWIIEHR